MISHVVMMKFKPEVKDSDIKDLEKRLDELPNTIFEILSYEFGKNIVQSERSFDFALVSLFANKGTLERYQNHPDHLDVVERIKNMCEKIHSVDFEGTDSASIKKDESSKYEKTEL